MSFYVFSEDDDFDFISPIDHLISIIVDSIQRPEVFVIRVDNWFDHKWLYFAGKSQQVYSDDPVFKQLRNDQRRRFTHL
jgi:hypothetical protein